MSKKTESRIQTEGGFAELEKFLMTQGERSRISADKIEFSADEKDILLAAEAVLTGVRTVFHTRDDNKDSDTRLECWINMAGEREAAYASRYGEFNDWSVNILDLGPKSNIMRKSDIKGSWLQIRIAPNGNDTWRFSCDCTLYFSDGSYYNKVFPAPTTLDQGSRQANKPL